MGNGPVPGGITIATNPALSNGEAVALAEWPAGTIVTSNHTGDQELVEDRYFYAGGSREAAGIPIQSSTMDLTVDGRRIYFNLVQYALGKTVPEPGDFNMDGSVNEDDYLLLNNNLAGQLDGVVGFPHGDIDFDRDVDLDDFGRFIQLYPAAAGLARGVPEPSTLGLLAIVLLSALGMRLRKSGPRRTLPLVLAAILCVAAGASTSLAQVNTEWTPTGVDDFSVAGNWSLGGVPDVAFDEIGTINNGGTAFVDSQIFEMPGAILLGEADGDVGTLDIRSGGELITDASGAPDGTITVGLEGEGHLSVLNGGSLTGTGLHSGGSANSSIVLGEAGGSGTASVTINGSNAAQRVVLAATTRITGPDVAFTVDYSTGNSFTLADSHNLVAEITGPAHSAINVIGTARLDGQLNVEFNGHTPAAGESWTLLDASSILGGFSNVNVDFEAEPGHGVFLEIGEGGDNGMTASLALEPRLQLSVDRATGNAFLENLTATETFDIKGYVVTSLDGSLLPDGWTSLADGDGSWLESANAASNHLSETNRSGTTEVGPAASLALGAIFAAPGEAGTLDEVSFRYFANGQSFEGLMKLVDKEITAGITGDYNASNQVEQGDLDLVLLNWGQQTPPVPDGWTNDLPDGAIDQAELDKVLLNWGNTSGLAVGSSVPEPATWLLTLVATMAAIVLRRSRR